jgi:hypothetical protein
MKQEKNQAVNVNNKVLQTNTGLQKKRKVHVYADSHGNNLGNLLEGLLPKYVETYVWASSGGTVNHILDGASKMIRGFKEDDTVFIIAGANNLCDVTKANQLPGKHVMDSLEKFSLVNSHTNVVYVTQLHRHDLAWDHPVNKAIYKVNYELKQKKNLNIINLSDFSRKLFSKHGQHLNKWGKQVLCRRLTDYLMTAQLNIRQSMVDKQTTLKVIEASMSEIIDQNWKNVEVGFAHCISEDFENDRKHMSKGVAVTFKEKVGRPGHSDYCGKNLTRQISKFGATVYSLVTKPKYFLKATNYSDYMKDYNNAFFELTQDFKARNLKTLICSPLGCVRDRVLVPHFVSNLIKFKQVTGADVIVVACHDPLSERLYNGLSYDAFIKYLRQTILNKYFEDVTSQQIKDEASNAPPVNLHPPTTTPTSQTTEVQDSLTPTPPQPITLQWPQQSSPVISDEGGIKVNGVKNVSSEQVIRVSENSSVQFFNVSNNLLSNNVSKLCISESESKKSMSNNQVFLESMSDFPPL